MLLKSLLLGLTVSACVTPPPDTGDGPWVVGSNLDNPPFAWVDNTGEPRGRDVVMAQIIADGLGRELVWKRMPFSQVLDRLEAGEVDSVIATLGYTPERAERVLMSEPYYVTALRALVRVGPEEPQKLGDLVGKTLSAGEGTTSERAIRRYASTVVLSDPSPISRAAPERLQKREIDGAIMDGPIAFEFAAEQPDFLRVLSTPIATEAYVVGVRPDQPELLEAIDHILDGMRAKGLHMELDALYGVPKSEALRLE
jgi:polar amino acid transport system substrate-binding protein